MWGDQGQPYMRSKFASVSCQHSKRDEGEEGSKVLYPHSPRTTCPMAFLLALSLALSLSLSLSLSFAMLFFALSLNAML